MDSTGPKKLISIVIPVYKSSRSLLVITQQVQELKGKMGINIELIFINDSPLHIETESVLKEICNRFDFSKVLTLRKNRGQHIALLLGLNEAKGQYIITMDDDLQHPVSEI